MTKQEFEKKYPNGLNSTIHNFDKSLYEIMTTDEIDKIIKHAKWSEKRFLKTFKKVYLELIEKKPDCMPVIWLILPAVENSGRLMADIIAYMVENDKTVYLGEDLKTAETE